MINVIVSYTVPTAFVEENKQNISAFLKDFEQLDQSRFSYRILQKNDGNTFVHISKYADEKMQKELLKVPSFLNFQKQRDESCTDIEQKIEVLEFIGERGNFKED